VNAESTRAFDAETLKRNFPELADPHIPEADYSKLFALESGIAYLSAEAQG
jgi:hypothetical protein